MSAWVQQVPNILHLHLKFIHHLLCARVGAIIYSRKVERGNDKFEVRGWRGTRVTEFQVTSLPATKRMLYFSVPLPKGLVASEHGFFAA